jgi:hypothetical protein
MSNKAYKVIEMVLNGATFNEAGQKLGYCKNGARSAFHTWVRKANPELYDAGLRHGASNNYATPPLNYLREHKEQFLKRNYLKTNYKQEETVELTIENAIVLLVKNGYRVEKC